MDSLSSLFLEKPSHELQVLTERMNTPMAKAMTELEPEHVDNAQVWADSGTDMRGQGFATRGKELAVGGAPDSLESKL